MNLCVLTEEDLLLIAETAANATDLSIHSASTFLTGKFKWGTLPAQWVPEWLHPAQLQTGAELLVDILNKWDPDSEVFFHSAGTGDGTRLDLWDHEAKVDDEEETAWWSAAGMLGHFACWRPAGLKNTASTDIECLQKVGQSFRWKVLGTLHQSPSLPQQDVCWFLSSSRANLVSCNERLWGSHCWVLIWLFLSSFYFLILKNLERVPSVSHVKQTCIGMVKAPDS